MRLIYRAGIHLYYLAIRLAALRDAKARKWLAGRRRWRQRMRTALQPVDRPLIWIHCASLGEFEQGRPVIERLKSRLPGHGILLTFFSPSGYEIRQAYPLADHVDYLPLDTPANARDFLEISRPVLAIFVKYEYWAGYLRALHSKAIPTILISALFRPRQIFFRSYGGFFRRLLPLFHRIFVQDEQSAVQLETLRIKRYEVAGDTRIDRVLRIAEGADEFPLVTAFAEAHKIFVAGSTWPADEDVLVPFFNEGLPEDWKAIIAPHQIKEAGLRRLEGQLTLPAMRFSKGGEPSVKDSRVLIIDNVGMLSALYRYGHLAYIGGGFGAGIHNTLEPMAFGLPVFFGPAYRKFTEAVANVKNGGAFVVHNRRELEKHFRQLEQGGPYGAASHAVRQFLSENRGASERVVEWISRELEQGEKP